MNDFLTEIQKIAYLNSKQICEVYIYSCSLNAGGYRTVIRKGEPQSFNYGVEGNSSFPFSSIKDQILNAKFIFPLIIVFKVHVSFTTIRFLFLLENVLLSGYFSLHTSQKIMDEICRILRNKGDIISLKSNRSLFRK